MSEHVLSLEQIGKRFGRSIALDDVTLRLRPGTVHALLGENGAGKTTLMHIAFGMVRPDAGQVLVHERRVTFDSPAAAIDAGIGMVHQHFTLVPTMTVAENLALGGHGRLRRRKTIEVVEQVASQMGFAIDPAARAADLSVGAQQRVEIAKALARNARILILDEPTAVLAPAEANELLRWTRRFADAGHAVVLITHKLSEALSIADEVTVLRRGRVRLTAAASSVTVDSLSMAMIGDDVPQLETVARSPALTGDAVFEARALVLKDDRGTVRLTDASFVVRAGEIVGIAAVDGAGQRELMRALAGRLPVAGGSLRRPPLVGFVPEDRHRDALLLDRSLTENVALRGAGARRGRIDWRSIRERTEAIVRAFDIRTTGTERPTRTLSGGNQQKLVVARELLDLESSSSQAGEGKAIVAENPTRGLDVRATAELHARLRQASAGGAAVVVFSSDLDEVLTLASRVLVLYGGRVREAPLRRDIVGRFMLGLDISDESPPRGSGA